MTQQTRMPSIRVTTKPPRGVTSKYVIREATKAADKAWLKAWREYFQKS